MRTQSLGREDPLEEGLATYSGMLARKIPCTEEPSGLPHLHHPFSPPLRLSRHPALQFNFKRYSVVELGG